MDFRFNNSGKVAAKGNNRRHKKDFSCLIDNAHPFSMQSRNVEFMVEFSVWVYFFS
jgi:hypothetical protein